MHMYVCMYVCALRNDYDDGVSDDWGDNPPFPGRLGEGAWCSLHVSDKKGTRLRATLGRVSHAFYTTPMIGNSPAEHLGKGERCC